jgi:ComF family protein
VPLSLRGYHAAVEWLRYLAEVFFPPACRLCRRSGEFPICRGCVAEFRLIVPPWCPICGRPLRRADSSGPCVVCRIRSPAFSRARAAGIYEGTLRDAIHVLKFRGCRTIAAPLGDLVASAAQAAGLRADVVVPVPLHPSRLRHRGFNQAELLARRAAGLLGLPCDAGVLRRTHRTEAQSRLARDTRLTNVRDVFTCAGALSGTRVLVVDDVIATGATASACAHALLAAGAEKVLVATVAAAILRRGTTE